MDPALPEMHDEPAGGRDYRDRLGAATGLLVVLAGLIVVLWILGRTSGEATDDAGEPADAGDPIEQALGGTPTSGARQPEDTGSSTAQRPAAEALQAEPFSPLQGRLVYLSGSDVAVVDLAGGDIARVPIKASGSITPLNDYRLLTDRNRTVALSLDADPPVALLVASAAVLVPSNEPFLDYWVVSRPNGPDGIVRLAVWHDYGFMSLGLEAPPGSELLADPEGGLLVIPLSGKTYRATYPGFELVSEHRVLGSRSGVSVEQRCDERLSCVVVVADAATVTASELPEDFVSDLSEISVSPDGRWVLNDTNPARLFDRGTGRSRLLEVGGFGQARWAEDSASVAWLTSDRAPTLVITEVRPDGESGWLAVELAALDADPSPRSSFMLDLDAPIAPSR